MEKKVLLDSAKRLVTRKQARKVLKLHRRPFWKLCKLKEISTREAKKRAKGSHVRYCLRKDPLVKQLRKDHAVLLEQMKQVAERPCDHNFPKAAKLLLSKYKKRLLPGVKPRSTDRSRKLPFLKRYLVNESRTNVEDILRRWCGSS